MDESLLITHYNKDYSHLLADVLRFYGSVAPATLQRASQLRITSLDGTEGTVVVTFNVPEMPLPIDKVILLPKEETKSSSGGSSTPAASAARRLDAMLLSAAAQSGRSVIQVSTCLAPSTIADLLVLLAVPLPLLCYFYRPLLYYLPLVGSILAPYLDNDKVLLLITAAELLCHATEAAVFLCPVLWHYRVPADMQVEWYFWSLLEGYSPVRRMHAYAQPREARALANLRH
ncbi:hypothetical protein DAKH74_038420 [Maudiozyma humilis]|uniref:DUF2470 domain-containing protein n=1 Tax=Maudiozyma humilis TaxID=51915 RepID=A0AAV5S0K3_MAUHU|nr:hypothetical protein DAKH74_038420 [Kazachstania humilis]